MDSDFDHAVGNVLWRVMDAPAGSAFAAAVPFRCEKGYAEGRVPDRPHRPGWEWFAALDALYAADPGRFVEECLMRGLRLR